MSTMMTQVIFTTVLCVVVIQASRGEEFRDNTIKTAEGSLVAEQNRFSADTMSMPGGIGEEKPADNDAQGVADQIRSSVEGKTGRKFDKFTVVRYATQVVAGTNFFIKVQVASDDYIHVRVYRDLSQTVSLSDYQLDKKLDDPITYF